MGTHKLTDVQLRTAKPKDKDYKLFDGGGLYLFVKKNGSKVWRHAYRFEGKEKTLTLGKYPDVGLKDAREKHQEARRLLAAGVNPSAHRKAQKEAVRARTANSFEVIAQEWFNKQLSTWKESHSKTVISRLENDIFPYLGNSPIAEITAPEVLKVLNKVVERGAIETAHKEQGICGQVFRYAIVTSRAERDPTADLRGALPPKPKPNHFAAITDPKRVGELM